MTSASELFYNRRSRFGRTSDPLGTGSDFGSHPHLDRANRRHRSHNSPGGTHARRNRLDPDGCDPFRRSRPLPPQLHRTSSHAHQEWESTRVEDNVHQFSSGNVSSRDMVRVSESGNERLPGAVVLARERLLQRLRGVTLFSTRRSNRGLTLSSGSHSNNIAITDDFRLVDAGDWETEISREWLSSIVPLTNFVDQQTSKRSPGLTKEALSRLCLETFSVVPDKQGSSRTITECSICLESFSEGDELIRLPCGHRNHFCCLEPWVRSCGDCPYCRRGIDVNLRGVDENQDC
ncbi:hypothetical protein CASFOL_042380 [Castilleja foliolosa]|uniref:RING-type domain-containing protein n=1 Tax=Castilleja foliolosa TaxID=1961234 RepID=A0ABD3BB29_9LAMI